MLFGEDFFNDFGDDNFTLSTFSSDVDSDTKSRLGDSSDIIIAKSCVIGFIEIAINICSDCRKSARFLDFYGDGLFSLKIGGRRTDEGLDRILSATRVLFRLFGFRKRLDCFLLERGYRNTIDFRLIRLFGSYGSLLSNLMINRRATGPSYICVVDIYSRNFFLGKVAYLLLDACGGCVTTIDKCFLGRDVDLVRLLGYLLGISSMGAISFYRSMEYRLQIPSSYLIAGVCANFGGLLR